MSADILYTIPLKPDPPITVDGDLADWQNVPNQFVLETKEHATYGTPLWKGPEDLSARGWLAWRAGVLFLGVDVTDDVLSQANRGRDLWRGDHVMLFLDFRPDHEPDRTAFGDGQFQIAFSPGNFQETGDPLIDFPPEAFVYQPADADHDAIRVAATKTPTGYVLEAALPFSLLGLDTVEPGTEFHGEIAISDSDSAESQQEKMMTLGREAWFRIARERLSPMLFGDAQGKATPAPKSIALRDAMTIPPLGHEEVPFESPVVPSGKEATIYLKARTPWNHVGGFSQKAMLLTVNGTVLAGSRVSNRPLRSKSIGGPVYALIAPSGEAGVYFSPDYESPKKDPYYGLLDGADPCVFEYRITDLLQEDGNTLHIQNLREPEEDHDRTLLLADVAVLIKAPPPPPRKRRPAPTGKIPAIVPDRSPRPNFQAREDGTTTLSITSGDDSYIVQSRFSSPDGKWNKGSSSFYEHKRSVKRDAEWIVVKDHFRNRSDRDVPIIQRHTCTLGDRLEKYWLGGLHIPAPAARQHNPENPSAYAQTADSGIGMLPLNDAFLVHVVTTMREGELALSDDSFVLAAGKEYTAEWAVIPTDTPDYWAFVNAARRLREVNFTLPHQFTFLRPGPKSWWPDESDESLKTYLENKGAHVVSMFGDGPYGQGLLQVVDKPFLARHHDRIRRLVPDIETMMYFHPFGSRFAGDDERFPDDRTLDADGTQIDYGGAYTDLKVFLPTETNAFGAKKAEDIDIILGPCGADGVYADEFEQCVVGDHYGEPWDGVSGVIDPVTFTLRRKKSSVSLVSQAYRVGLLREMMSRGPFLANGSPQTRTIAALNTQRFVETGSLSHCAKAVLYSPVALGDHLTERNIQDAYRNMLAVLDYGLLYNWYDDVVFPHYKTLACHMFPFTPIELHAGYVIGEERIITKISGLYGWGDAAAHEVHVFDEYGMEVEDFDAPFVTKDGKTYTELRIAEDWSAAIIRMSVH